VRKRYRQSTQLDRLPHNVARRSRHGRDDRPLASDQTVQQRRLPGIRPSDDQRCQTWRARASSPEGIVAPLTPVATFVDASDRITALAERVALLAEIEGCFASPAHV